MSSRAVGSRSCAAGAAPGPSRSRPRAAVVEIVEGVALLVEDHIPLPERLGNAEGDVALKLFVEEPERAARQTACPKEGHASNRLNSIPYFALSYSYQPGWSRRRG